jgi:putative oxidoreductase
MLSKLIKTNDNYSLTIVRLVLGIVFLAHGCQKVLGWFGGSGFTATMGMFETYMHIPAPFAFLAIMAEFLGGLGLIVGLLGRVAAFGIAVNMFVAIFKVHAANGLFMNWGGNQKGEGFEYHLLVLAIAFAVMIYGSGALSLDRAWYMGQAER